ncbi:MAG: tetratricopeptide repeat protein [Pirellulaceae bacterium]
MRTDSEMQSLANDLPSRRLNAADRPNYQLAFAISGAVLAAFYAGTFWRSAEFPVSQSFSTSEFRSNNSNRGLARLLTPGGWASDSVLPVSFVNFQEDDDSPSSDAAKDSSEQESAEEAEDGDCECSEECEDCKDDFVLGLNALEEEEYEAAIELFAKAAEDDDRGGAAQYNIACSYALMEKPSEALPWLDKALASGFIDVRHYLQDDDLASLKDDVRFEKFIVRVNKAALLEEKVSKAVDLRQRDRLEEACVLLEEVLEEKPEHEYAALEYGLALHLDGKLDKALKWHRRAAKSKQYADYGNYNIACYHALNGDVETACDFLETAIELGMKDYIHMKQDSDLDSLREEDRFGAMMEELKEEHEENMSERIRAMLNIRGDSKGISL